MADTDNEGNPRGSGFLFHVGYSVSLIVHGSMGVSRVVRYPVSLITFETGRKKKRLQNKSQTHTTNTKVGAWYPSSCLSQPLQEPFISNPTEVLTVTF